MSAADPIELRARGRKVTGWTALSLSSSLEEAASTLSASVSGYYAATGDDQLACGDLARVYVGDDLAWTGYVEAPEDAIDGESEATTVTGRSKTCDAVDCAAAAGSWTGLTLAALFARLIGDHDLELLDEAGVGGTVIPRHRTEPGETIHDALDRLSREVGYLVTDDGRGRVVLTRAGAGGRAATSIVQGAGVLSSQGGWDVSQRFSHYEVAGQVVEDTDVDVHAFGLAEDPGVGRTRRMVIVPERGMNKAQARRRAQWEAVTRAGRSFVATYQLRGWRHGVDTGALWRPNQIVSVVDGRRGLFGVDLLVTAVTLTLDEGGRRAAVTVQPAAGFELYTTGLAAGVGVGRWFTTEAARALGAQAAGR